MYSAQLANVTVPVGFCAFQNLSAADSACAVLCCLAGASGTPQAAAVRAVG